MKKKTIKIVLMNGESATEGQYQWTEEQIKAIEDFMHQLRFHEAHKAEKHAMTIHVKEER